MSLRHHALAEPPAIQPWSGASERLIVGAGDRWITPAERNGFTKTPDHEDRATI